MLRSCRINVDCLPLLDVRQEGASDIIGDRALGSEPMQVAALGRAVLDGMASAGVVGIVKHMPGHGRALVDSHKELPVVTASAEELEIDLEPFERLRVGADGDDRARRLHRLGRGAPGEPVADRDRRHHPRPHRLRRLADERRHRHGSARRAISAAARPGVVAAGCDVALHCSGKMDEMVAVAGAVPAMSAEGEARLARAMATTWLEPDGADLRRGHRQARRACSRWPSYPRHFVARPSHGHH